MGLYLAVERGYTERAVQQAHQRLAACSREWPRFMAPEQVGDVTVADVTQAQPGRARDDALRTWVAAVWDAWRADRATIAALVARFLDT
jgi:copper oxidase (laccase) domain-containing protein